jgi:hypothetical protein
MHDKDDDYLPTSEEMTPAQQDAANSITGPLRVALNKWIRIAGKGTVLVGSTGQCDCGNPECTAGEGPRQMVLITRDPTLQEAMVSIVRVLEAAAQHAAKKPNPAINLENFEEILKAVARTTNDLDDN